MKKRIVLCLDGTWNQVTNPKRVTNVVKLAQAVRSVSSEGVEQIVYYNSGVGTGDPIDKFLGGVFGRGLLSNVKRGYAFLSLNYEPGDEIYIFGFSRGAYTARALAGVIAAAGILRKDEYHEFEVAWDIYRQPKEVREAAKNHALKAKLGRAERPLEEDSRVVAGSLTTGASEKVARYVEFVSAGKFYVDARVRCVGVWDTVGSYGIPAGIGLGALSRLFTAYLLRGFHDTEISAKIDIGLHAVGVDERRRPFAPTFWTMRKGSEPPAHVEQVWFVGVHANVGGSYEDTGLADLALIWMMARVFEIGRDNFQSALEFDDTIVGQKLRPSSRGMLYRSNAGWPISTIWPYIRPVLAPHAIEVRAVLWNGENPDDEHINEKVHESVFERLGKSAPVDGKGDVVYQPENLAGLKVPDDRLAKRSPEEVRLTRLTAAAPPIPGLS